MDLEVAVVNVSLLWLLTTPHEYAHAWMAIRLGDDTPKLEGRNTLNPLAHVDWIGTVALPAVTSLFGGGFIGWGKPVNTNPYRLRWGLKGLAVVALAGPASNVVFAFILGAAAAVTAGVAPLLAEFFAQGVYLSLYLAIFNMIPVPPLDGSKLLLAARIPAVVYHEIARFGFLLIIVAMFTTNAGYVMSDWAMAGARGILALVS